MILITNGKNFEYKKVFGIKTLRVFELHCEFPGLIYVSDKEYGLRDNYGMVTGIITRLDVLNWELSSLKKDFYLITQLSTWMNYVTSLQ